MEERVSFVDLNLTNKQARQCHEIGLIHPEQLYVNLSTFWYCFLALITLLGLIISLISNMIIIYLFISNASLRKSPSNIIAVNLSLSDLLYCLQWPSVIYCCLTQSTWILEKIPFVCQSFGFITVSTALASILTVLVMSIERAIVIKYSIQAKNMFTNGSAWFIIIVIWLVSLISGLPPLFGKFNRYTLDPSKTSCTLDYLSTKAEYKLYILVLYVAYWIAPTILITISYIAIIITFKKSSLSLKQIDSESPKPGSINSSTKSSTQQSRRRLSQDPLRLRTFIASCRRRASIEIEELSLRRSSGLEQSNDANKPYLGEMPTISMLIANQRRLIRRTSSTSILPTNYSSGAQHSILSGLSSGSFKGGDSIGKGKFSGLLSQNRDSARIYRQRRIGACQDSNIDAYGVSISASTIATHPRSDKLDAISSHLSSANSQFTRTVLQFRLAKMSFYLILLWLVSWTPIASLAMINSVLECHQTSATAVFLASTMTKLGPAFDVFIYGISHPKIKSKFKEIVRWMLLISDKNSIDKIPRENSVHRTNMI